MPHTRSNFAALTIPPIALPTSRSTSGCETSNRRSTYTGLFNPDFNVNTPNFTAPIRANSAHNLALSSIQRHPPGLEAHSQGLAFVEHHATPYKGGFDLSRQFLAFQGMPLGLGVHGFRGHAAPRARVEHHQVRVKAPRDSPLVLYLEPLGRLLRDPGQRLFHRYLPLLGKGQQAWQEEIEPRQARGHVLSLGAEFFLLRVGCMVEGNEVDDALPQGNPQGFSVGLRSHRGVDLDAVRV